MSTFLVSTAEEGDGATEERTTGLVLLVLQYDRLHPCQTTVLPPLAQEGALTTIGRAMEVGPPRIVPGQGLDKTVLVGDSFISREHAKFYRRKGADYLVDMGSRHGTYVNGERVVGERLLSDRDWIEMGRTLFVYRYLQPSVAGRSVMQQGGIRFGPTVTFCPEMMGIVHHLRKVAESSAPVMVLGETGTGKEVAAQFLHDKSRRKGAFVAIDCGALAPSLMESALFGHKRGAYTGATEARKGLFRAAEGGTVFLDEIGNLSAGAQAVLLRVLEEKAVRPVGADAVEPVDVRWVSATNADVFDSSVFREDLCMRLAAQTVRLLPLRERREDLGVLVAHGLEKAGATHLSIAPDAARLLFGGPLVGNVRGLLHALTSAAPLAEEGVILRGHLSTLLAYLDNQGKPSPRPPERAAEPPRKPGPRAEGDEEDEGPGDAPKRAKRPSAELLREVLESAGGRQAEAARLLGTSEKQIARWMDHYEIPRAAARGEGKP